MSGIERRETRARYADGTVVDGPGYAPRGPRPTEMFVACPSCDAPARLDPHALTDKLWHGRERGDGEAELAPELRAALDDVDRSGWDVSCSACGAGFRVRYAIDEWGKMSNAFFPAIEGTLSRAR